MSVKLLEKPNAPEVLTKAVLRAAEKLDISQAMLAKVLGVGPLTISSLYSGDYRLDECRKEWKFALLFVQVFNSLDSIVGSEMTACAWLKSENKGLNGRPIDLIGQIDGLARVADYLGGHEVLSSRSL